MDGGLVTPLVAVALGCSMLVAPEPADAVGIHIVPARVAAGQDVTVTLYCPAGAKGGTVDGPTTFGSHRAEFSQGRGTVTARIPQEADRAEHQINGFCDDGEGSAREAVVSAFIQVF
ncbi:hypothetical protein C1I98_34340 [Spongiactinospora gelatinilytica]|uniref:Uncharacterized protein n=2 Tax=Spongiactinospora gelatinilytica TaxID=2666298 RepID=A0A2W2EMY0_9ACTN|nr:hypothetical protein C1I98_34340 [Spongiactinospora gelatinilytica]